MRLIIAVHLVVSCVAAWASEPKLAQADLFTPPPPGSVLMEGRLGVEIEKCIGNRLLKQELEPLIRPYRDKTEVGSGDWRCEYWGKWFTSLALADAYQSTPATRAKCRDGYNALVATAAPDGYLGTRKPEHRLQGWDVWGRKYALLGLLAYYDRTRDPQALQAACRHADTLLAQVGPSKSNIVEIGEHKGLAASSVLEPMVGLYQRTGDPRYLDFSEYIVQQWSLPSSKLTNGLRLIQDSLARKRPADMSWNKAYEMMSCFEGLCELHRTTGNKDYLQAATALADGIIEHEVTIVGPGTQIEHWFNGRTNQTMVVNRPMETCVTATWMKYLYQLLRLTGDPRYTDELEKNLYNGLLGAVMPDGSWWAYFSGVMGERVPSDWQHEDAGMSCCVVNGPRSLMQAPFWAVMNSESGPVVNLYAPAKATLKTPGGKPVELTIRGDYPAGGKVTLTVSPAEPEEFTLHLRIPGWSARTALTVRGTTHAAQSGTFSQVKRRWKAGDEVRLEFDMRGRLIPAPDGNGQLAVARGPIVLALDDRFVPAATRQLTLVTNSFPYIPLQAVRNGGPAAWMKFEVPALVDGKRRTIVMCDYASAGAAWATTNRFRTWLPQPLDLSKAYETGQTWQLLTHRPYRPEIFGKPPRDPK